MAAAAERTALLELNGLSMSFGGLKVIDNLDLVVNQSEVVSVIGPNGAGKTTLFNLITGIYQPDAGEILLGGQSLVGMAPHTITKNGVARTFQTLRLFLNMSVIENVMASQYGRTKVDVFRAMLRTPGDAPRGEGDQSARRGEALLLRPAPDGLSLEPARVFVVIREPAAARDRAGDGDRAADPPARRARRGHEPDRDARDHGADRASCATRAATRSS